MENPLLKYDSDDYYSALTSKIENNHAIKIKELLKETIHKYGDLFTDEFFKSKLISKKKSVSSKFRIYEQNGTQINVGQREDEINIEDDLFSLILPFIRRAYSKFFINPPSIFDKTLVNLDQSGRLLLFQSHFELEDLLMFFKEKVKKNLHILDDFNHLDRSPLILSLIVDDYIGMKLELTQNSQSIKKDIRNLKIKKING